MLEDGAGVAESGTFLVAGIGTETRSVHAMMESNRRQIGYVGACFKGNFCHD